jgi:hypothetical protein
VTASRAIAPDLVTQKPFGATTGQCSLWLSAQERIGSTKEVTMHLGRDMAAGYVEDTESDAIASEELAVDAPALTQPAPDPHPQPAVIAG